MFGAAASHVVISDHRKVCKLDDAVLHIHLLKVGFVVFLTEGDPTNYMSYFRRAAVYLAMGKSKSALPDLDFVLSLKPDFIAVSVPRCYIYCGL